MSPKCSALAYNSIGAADVYVEQSLSHCEVCSDSCSGMLYLLQTRAQEAGKPLKKPGAYNTDAYYEEVDQGFGDVGVDQVSLPFSHLSGVILHWTCISVWVV
jgi:hypothetical protein